MAIMRKNFEASKVVPVILCGGSGTRLWPASRETHPKQFLKLMGDCSLIQDTMNRALRISGAPAKNLVTVTLAAMRDGVEAQLSEMDPDAALHILSEPSARDTAAAVAFAAHYIQKTFGADAIMWVLPADHHIADEEAMAHAFRHAMTAAQQDYLVTFGICPQRPETGYGYILQGDALMNDSIYNAARFVEKPDLETARQYLDAKNYLWNSGMFVFAVDRVLSQFEKYAKDVNDAVIRAMEASLVETEVRADYYAAIEKKPFDKAIMEKSSRVAVVPCDPEWSDIGSWETLWEMSEKDANGNATLGRGSYFDAQNCFVQGKRLIACAGVQNLVVVETEDAILVADRSNGDAMKGLVNTLKAEGHREVTEMPSSVVSMPTPSGYAVRDISVFVGETHTFKGASQIVKNHFLTIIKGSAQITTQSEQKTLNAGEVFFIQPDMICKVRNVMGGELVMVEVNQEMPSVNAGVIAQEKLRNVA